MTNPEIEPPYDSRPVACVSCDRPATDDGFCKSCAAAVELALTEDERIMCRDLIATFLIDETGTHRYDVADAIWMMLYRKGFDIMRRSYGKPADGN